MYSRAVLLPLDTQVQGNIRRSVCWGMSSSNQLRLSGVVIDMKLFAAISRVTIPQNIARNVASTGAIKKDQCLNCKCPK